MGFSVSFLRCRGPWSQSEVWHVRYSRSHRKYCSMRFRNHRFLTFSRSLIVLFPYRPLLPLVSVPLTQNSCISLKLLYSADRETKCKRCGVLMWGWFFSWIYFPAGINYFYVSTTCNGINRFKRSGRSKLSVHFKHIYMALTNPWLTWSFDNFNLNPMEFHPSRFAEI